MLNLLQIIHLITSCTSTNVSNFFGNLNKHFFGVNKKNIYFTYYSIKKKLNLYFIKKNYFVNEIDTVYIIIISLITLYFLYFNQISQWVINFYSYWTQLDDIFLNIYYSVYNNWICVKLRFYWNIINYNFYLYLNSIYTYVYDLVIFYIIDLIYNWSFTKTFLFFWNFDHIYCLNSYKYDHVFNYFNFFKGYLLNIDSLKTNLLEQINYTNINSDFNFSHKYNQTFYKVNSINLNIYTKYSPNFTFLSRLSLTLTILSVWQYWWWLYFIGIAVLFNKIIFKLFFDTNLYINPKVHNSLKSNGRWGDIIASSFPVFWCSNILLNSNLILRLTENHSEAGWMTLRVRGKQWYWVYKLPIHLKHDFEKLPIIIGRGNKLTINQLKPINTTFYKNLFLKKQKLIFIKNYQSRVNFLLNKKILLKRFKKNYFYFFTDKQDFFYFVNQKELNSYYLTKKVKANKLYYKFIKNTITLAKNNTFQKATPFLQIQTNYNHWYKKYYRHFFTIQQQPKTNWLLKNKVNLNSNQKTKFFEINTLKKKNFLNKQRLISSYNTLLLPTNVNITVITNSFDVVHSWFIPGLGVKFDCVPGRSTHYTLRINKPGIYLGHCAEICGRFHHHMPIKIVALPLNQFLYYYDHYYPEN